MANTCEESSRASYNPQQQSKANESFANIRQQSGDDNKQKVRYGTIVNAWEQKNTSGQDELRIVIRFDDKMDAIKQGSYPNSFVLTQTISEIATLYGTIDDIIGLKVSVMSSGARLNQGLATIINKDGIGSLDKAHILSPFGTFLAPAGGSSL